MNLNEFLSEFQLEAGEKLDIIASQLVQLERDSTNPQPVREMFLAAHTIKGGAAMLRLTDVEALAHGVEELLSTLRDQQPAPNARRADGRPAFSIDRSAARRDCQRRRPIPGKRFRRRRRTGARPAESAARR